ncbi:MAG TPA: DUF4869 domain-containing protein [Lachnospiraceae bacterium]|nr:DUF4869 domain-containing protein [Lachnospiraceae bacterium]
MLYIHVGQIERECIRTIDPYFNRNKSKDWFNRDDVKRIIKNIDLSVAVKDEYIESPVFGGMSPTKLSTGCKAVILMAVLEKPYIYATKCGDNCVTDILEIASKKDVHITLHHIMQFPESGFEAVMAESEKKICTFGGFVDEYYRIRDNF